MLVWYFFWINHVCRTDGDHSLVSTGFGVCWRDKMCTESAIFRYTGSRAHWMVLAVALLEGQAVKKKKKKTFHGTNNRLKWALVWYKTSKTNQLSPMTFNVDIQMIYEDDKYQIITFSPLLPQTIYFFTVRNKRHHKHGRVSHFLLFISACSTRKVQIWTVIYCHFQDRLYWTISTNELKD